MAGLWTNYILPHLIESGAIGGPAEAGRKTLLRLRWLFIVAQISGSVNQQRSIRIGNRMLMDEDFFGDSDDDDNYADGSSASSSSSSSSSSSAIVIPLPDRDRTIGLVGRTAFIEHGNFQESIQGGRYFEC